MASNNSFNPNGFLNFQTYGTIVLASSGTSAQGNFTSSLSIQANSVMIYNGSSTVVFVNFGVSTATATAPTTTESASSIPVAPGAIVVLTKNIGSDAFAVINPAGTGNVYFSAGEGA